MDSKFTKAIPRQFTNKASSITGRASCTADPSPASKNTSDNSARPTYWAHERGLHSESLVIQHYQLKHCHLLGQRVKTPFAEVDLLFKTPRRTLLMVEVKTTNLSDFQPFRITKKQKARLVRAMIFLAARWDIPVEIHWAFVTKDGQITVFEDID